MKIKNHFIFIAVLSLFLFPNCHSDKPSVEAKDGTAKENPNRNEAIHLQISGIENALSNLVKSTYGDTAIGLDTSGIVVNLDTMSPENAIQFRLSALEETIRSINAQKVNKSAVKCDSVLIGTQSCNCSPPDVSGGAVHCDLCGIYKVVCK